MDKPRYNKIKAALAQKGVSNLKLAEAIGVTKGTVSNWCTNENQPSVETLFEIAEYLNVEVGALFNSRSDAWSSETI